MRQRQLVMIQASVLRTILAVALVPAKADTPHTFGHATEEAGHATTTTYFGLDSKSIASLDGVRDYTAAKNIVLGYHEISNIPSDAFARLSGQQELDLEENQITSISSGAFPGHSSLHRLSLDQNQITIIQTDAFSGLSGLCGESNAVEPRLRSLETTRTQELRCLPPLHRPCLRRFVPRHLVLRARHLLRFFPDRPLDDLPESA